MRAPGIPSAARDGDVVANKSLPSLDAYGSDGTIGEFERSRVGYSRDYSWKTKARPNSDP